METMQNENEQQSVLKACNALQRWTARFNRGWNKSHRKVRCVVSQSKKRKVKTMSNRNGHQADNNCPTSKALEVMESDMPLSTKLAEVQLVALPIDLLRKASKPNEVHAFSRSVQTGVNVLKNKELVDQHSTETKEYQAKKQQDKQSMQENHLNLQLKQARVQVAQAQIQALEAEIAALNGN